jgi:hypothetical protein
MPFGRRRAAHRSRETKARDPFDHLADERRAAESDAWFMRPDDAPPIEVQAGVSSNLSDADVADQPSAAGDQGDDTGGAGDNVDTDAL